MAEARLKAEILVRAHLRLCDQAMLPGVVRRKGDADAGAILIKLDRLDGTCVVLSQVRTVEGELAWMRATGEDPTPDADGEAYITKQLKFDPDIWVLDVEDPKAQYQIDGKLV